MSTEVKDVENIEEFLPCENEDDLLQALLTKEKEVKLLNEVSSAFDELEDTDRVCDDNSQTKSFDEVKESFELKRKAVDTFSDNITTNIEIKRNYSFILIITLGIQFLALDTIFILVGCNVLQYSKTTLNLFLTIGFLELIGLVTIVVKYVFADNISESLKIILGVETKNKK